MKFNNPLESIGKGLRKLATGALIVTSAAGSVGAAPSSNPDDFSGHKIESSSDIKEMLAEVINSVRGKPDVTNSFEKDIDGEFVKMSQKVRVMVHPEVKTSKYIDKTEVHVIESLSGEVQDVVVYTTRMNKEKKEIVYTYYHDAGGRGEITGSISFTWRPGDGSKKAALSIQDVFESMYERSHDPSGRVLHGNTVTEMGDRTDLDFSHGDNGELIVTQNQYANESFEVHVTDQMIQEKLDQLEKAQKDAGRYDTPEAQDERKALEAQKPAQLEQDAQNSYLGLIGMFAGS